MVNVLSSRTGYTLSFGADGFTVLTLPRFKGEFTFVGTNSRAFFTTEVTLRTEVSLVLRLWWILFAVFAKLYVALSLCGVKIVGAFFSLTDMWEGTENKSAAHYVAPDRSTLMIAGRTGVVVVVFIYSCYCCYYCHNCYKSFYRWRLSSLQMSFLLFTLSSLSEDKSILIFAHGGWEMLVVVVVEEEWSELLEEITFLWREVLFLLIMFLFFMLLLSLFFMIFTLFFFYNSNGDLCACCWDDVGSASLVLVILFIFLQVTFVAKSVGCGVFTRSSCRSWFISSFTFCSVVTLLGLTTVGVQLIAASFSSCAYCWSCKCYYRYCDHCERWTVSLMLLYGSGIYVCSRVVGGSLLLVLTLTLVADASSFYKSSRLVSARMWLIFDTYYSSEERPLAFAGIPLASFTVEILSLLPLWSLSLLLIVVVVVVVIIVLLAGGFVGPAASFITPFRHRSTGLDNT